MDELQNLYRLPPAKFNTAPRNLIFQARYNGFLHPIFLGYDAAGEIILCCDQDLTVDRAVRMLEQAKLQCLGVKPK